MINLKMKFLSIALMGPLAFGAADSLQGEDLPLSKSVSPLKRDFSILMRNIAERHSIKLRPLIHEWSFVMTKGDESHMIFYYDFDINGSASYQGCKDKATTSFLLSQEGIPCVEHRLFVTPADSKYSPRTGVWPTVEEYARQFNYQVVCKPANGSGGVGVDKASSLLELERLYVQNLGAGQYDFYVSPAVDIEDEYRLIMLDEEPQLIYRKVRPEILGDGVSTARALFLDYLRKLPSESFNEFFVDFKGIPSHMVDQILPEGRRHPLKWKHNLDQGGMANTSVPEATRAILLPMAQKSMKAVNIRFASVDIIKTGEDLWKVLEINAGVMTKHFMKQNGEEGKRVVESIYENAICKMFNIPTSAEALRMYGESFSKIFERDSL
jgi:glutathione synthase/RimK-type ligase-like ATP-grasp enzyme